MRRRLPALLCLLPLLAATACQKQNLAQKEQKAEAGVCSQLASVGEALEKVAALKPSSTVGEASDAEQSLGAALAGLETSEQKLEKLRLQAFQGQLKAFRAEVAKVASDKKQTLEQAAEQLRAKAEPVIAARRQLSAAVKCEEPAAAKP
ncbi:MAG: hypothetical protein ACKOXO_00005 [Cyanobium sp.]